MPLGKQLNIAYTNLHPSYRQCNSQEQFVNSLPSSEPKKKNKNPIVPKVESPPVSFQPRLRLPHPQKGKISAQKSSNAGVWHYENSTSPVSVVEFWATGVASVPNLSDVSAMVSPTCTSGIARLANHKGDRETEKGVGNKDQR